MKGGIAPRRVQCFIARAVHWRLAQPSLHCTPAESRFVWSLRVLIVICLQACTLTRTRRGQSVLPCDAALRSPQAVSNDQW